MYVQVKPQSRLTTDITTGNLRSYSRVEESKQRGTPTSSPQTAAHPCVTSSYNVVMSPSIRIQSVLYSLS